MSDSVNFKGLGYWFIAVINLMPAVASLQGIDGGEPGNGYLAAAIYIGLISLFGIQHSVMARPRFKRWLAGVLPQAAERSTFMLATAVVVFMLCLAWQPMPVVV